MVLGRQRLVVPPPAESAVGAAVGAVGPRVGSADGVGDGADNCAGSDSSLRAGVAVDKPANLAGGADARAPTQVAAPETTKTARNTTTIHGPRRAPVGTGAPDMLANLGHTIGEL